MYNVWSKEQMCDYYFNQSDTAPVTSYHIVVDYSNDYNNNIVTHSIIP